MKVIVEFPNMQGEMRVDNVVVRAEDADWAALGCNPENEDFETEKLAVILTSLEAGIAKILADRGENVHHVESMLAGVCEKIHSLTAGLYSSRVGSEAILADLLGSILTRKGLPGSAPRVSVIPIGSAGSPEELKRMLEKVLSCKDCTDPRCSNAGKDQPAVDKCKLN